MAASSRIERARARARGAKAGLGALTALVFGVAFVGARTHAPGHAKHPAKPLAAPSSFERAVRRGGALRAGQIAPPVQPPAVVTSTS